MSAARPPGRSAALAAALAVLALPGCSGSLFQSKEAPATVYVLSPAPPAARADAAGPELPLDLAVLKPRVRAGLEGERIAVLYTDQRLDYFAAARWSGPLPDVLQDAVVQALRLRSRLRGVSADASVFASAYWLELEVSDFEAEYAADGEAPTVHVHLMGRIGGSGDRRVIARFEADVREPAAANRLTAIVASFARAAGTALDQVAAQADKALGDARQPSP